MSSIRSILITGANAGLGLECAHQMAREDGIQRVYLACRNEDKALTARSLLEAKTGRSIFEILLMDMMDLDSIKKAVSTLDEPVDAVVLNAGGMGGMHPNELTSDGVTHIFAVNVLGHVVLVNELLRLGLLRQTVLYAGSEAARGISSMGVSRPVLDSSSVDEFISIANGSKFSRDTDPMVVYGTIKLIGAFWMASMAKQHPQVRFITMSPGGTTGTNGMDDLPFIKKLLFKYIGRTLMPLFGMMHGVQVGARRYVDGLMNDTQFKTGRFYASQLGAPTGPVVDQATLFPDLDSPSFHENSHRAINQFV